MYSITNVNGRINSDDYREYLLDSSDDVLKLPTSTKEGTQEITENSDFLQNDICSPGSIAFCLNPLSIYVLGNDDVWHKI